MINVIFLKKKINNKYLLDKNNLKIFTLSIKSQKYSKYQIITYLTARNFFED